jgi:hypothetical protein
VHPRFLAKQCNTNTPSLRPTIISFPLIQTFARQIGIPFPVRLHEPRGPRFISFVTDETAARTAPRIDLALQPDTIEEQNRGTSRQAESHCFPRTPRALLQASDDKKRPVQKGFAPTRGQPSPTKRPPAKLTTGPCTHPADPAAHRAYARRECAPYHAARATLLRHALVAGWLRQAEIAAGGVFVCTAMV